LSWICESTTASLRWKSRLSVALFFGLALLAACGGNRRSLFGGDITVATKIDPRANQDNPIAVELVIVYDKKLLEQLLALPAREWFKRREQIRRDYPDDEGFVSWKWEWVPGQEVPPQELSFGVGVRGGIVYADYLTEGDHRARIDPHQSFTLILGEKELATEPLP
jgi:type VI secretion system protein